MIASAIRRLILPVAILLAALAALHFLAANAIGAWAGVSPRGVFVTLAVIGWAASAIVLCRLSKILIWDQLGRTSDRPTPQLLIQITNVLICSTVALTMAAILFNIPLTGAIATSSVIGLVIGFAVKSLISDTFSGIALNLDRGFGINDFVLVMSRSSGVETTGRVVEINWRSTSIITPENSLMVIPNTLMSESIVINYSKPERRSEFELLVSLDIEVGAERATRVLAAAAQAAARDNAAIFDTKVRLFDATGGTLSLKIKYMLDPSMLSPGAANHLLWDHVLRHLAATGLQPARPKLENRTIEPRDIDRTEEAATNRLRLLDRVDLFVGIEPTTLLQLADGMTRHLYRTGERLIVAGEPGESMFVLAEGLVSVRIAQDDGELDVAALSPGQFFGEMSLLTGEPRSATVVAITDTVAFEIDRAAIELALKSNPSAAEMISLAAAGRRLSSDAARLAQPPETIAAERSSVADKILATMSRFLGLGVVRAEAVKKVAR